MGRSEESLITPLVAEARRAGAVGYLAKQQSRCAAAHVSDIAKLYVFALDKGEPGARYHASVEDGVTARGIAKAIGMDAGLPVRSISAAHVEVFWLDGTFRRTRHDGSKYLTGEQLGLNPTGTDLFFDLAAVDCSALAERAAPTA